MQNNIFSGVFVGQNLVTLKEVDSTNTFLKNILAKSEPVSEGTVIMAESQIAGRGQQQNRWYSSTGESLAFSILLNPTFLKPDQQFDLTRAISLGVYQALNPLLGTSLRIKWPNDIYIDKRKLGGILIENQIQGSIIKNSVIGIGLNINQASFPEWVPNAVSLKQILHTDYDLKAILFEICRGIAYWYVKLKAGEISLIREQYLKALYRFNEPGKFKANSVEFEGTIKSVQPNGLLEVWHNDEPKLYNLKEIEFLNK
ncbi:biotin--[acetyl-CoA-carboxylase] ligase [Mucilaginibacter lacusdianchii]|uniref:biotin--[acetyl-CoA-carboxylase] ligase n=1 Tax=Mucilaginibacter lacusdianchii TaxID=2684211 RepID=UPI00131B8CF9|nr:biotin--[acetyl-CoA-carboxylase] ligase [Mucilaginibacter sp. JXJ CY 39]